MNAETRLKLLSKYPAWAEHPFRLTNCEVEDPWLVIEDFMDQRRLSQTRLYFEGIRESIIISDALDTTTHLWFLKNLERAIEAISLLHKKRRLDIAKSAEEIDAPFPDPDDREEKSQHRVLLFDWSIHNPWENIREVYRYVHASELNKVFSQWIEAALTNTAQFYSEGEERSELLRFCKNFEKLMFAAYAMHLVHHHEQRGGLQMNVPAHLQEQLLREHIPSILSDDELNDPKSVIQTYFREHTIAYTRAELWNLMDCMICHENMQQKSNLLTDFECFYALVLAAWAIMEKYIENPNQEEDE